MEAWLKDKFRGDWQIWFIVIVLSLASTLVVYSSTSALAYKHNLTNEHYLISHATLLFAGIFLIWLVHRIDYTIYARISNILIIGTAPLLVITYFFGTTVGGASRWISIFGIVSFQTSDLVRIILITHLSAMLARRQNIEYTPKEFYKIIGWCVGLCGMIAFSNFSTAVILGVTCLVIMWIGRVPSKYIIYTTLGGTAVLLLSVIGGVIAKKYNYDIGRGTVVVERVEAFSGLDLDGDNIIGNADRDDNFQREQALIAVARGGILGIGPGNSLQRNYLPEAFSDYIYAILVEEYGMLGGITTVLLYLWLFYRGLINIRNTDRAFGGLLSVGLIFSIVFQAFIHIMINVGLGPVTGQTLPLMSKGGTSILFTALAIGIVLSITRDKYEQAR
jgi:cell division protein FtsW